MTHTKTALLKGLPGLGNGDKFPLAKPRLLVGKTEIGAEEAGKGLAEKTRRAAMVQEESSDTVSFSF